MIWLTHSVFAFLISKLWFNELSLTQAIFLFFASVFPDIDNKKSLIGKVFKLNIKHREIFHSLIFFLPLSYVFYIFLGEKYFVLFLIGSVSHILLDSLTKSGVRILYPMKFRIKGFFKTNSFSEYLLLFLFLILLIFF